MTAHRLRTSVRFLKSSLIYGAIIAVTLLAVDVLCIALNLFPPAHVFGDPDLGWRPASATGQMALGRCVDVMTGETIDYSRNEDAVRTSLSRDQIRSDTVSVKIAVSGDSQTELCARNQELHSGVLESELASHGVRAIALPYAAGKYSPLQAYLAFKGVLKQYQPQVFVLNFYTGNDFYDILRVDDRPHFAATDSGYQIRQPVWYSLDNPDSGRNRSRVLFAIRSLADQIGVRRIFLRVSELRRVGEQQGAGLSVVIAYMKDLWKARESSVGYPDAFTSQMLNQQLFFHHFPPSKDEALRRVRALLELARTENPDVVFVMSPLPSYQLATISAVDSVLFKTLQRIPVSHEKGVQQEAELYDRLRELAAEQGWLFVDNLAALRSYKGTERLYNDFDYHLLPRANALVGKAQASVLLDALHRQPGPPPNSKARP